MRSLPLEWSGRLESGCNHIVNFDISKVFAEEISRTVCHFTNVKHLKLITSCWDKVS